MSTRPIRGPSWLTRSVLAIVAATFFSDVGHEMVTSGDARVAFRSRRAQSHSAHECPSILVLNAQSLLPDHSPCRFREALDKFRSISWKALGPDAKPTAVLHLFVNPTVESGVRHVLLPCDVVQWFLAMGFQIPSKVSLDLRPPPLAHRTIHDGRRFRLRCACSKRSDSDDCDE
jgi:hypothetical protein